MKFTPFSIIFLWALNISYASASDTATEMRASLSEVTKMADSLSPLSAFK